MAKKKKHHYIPRFYLNGFVDPENYPFLWVYDKRKIKPFKSKPENIAFETYYYSFKTPNGNKDSNTFEDMFDEIETNTGPILKKLKSCEMLNEEERLIFSVFLGFSLTRVPDFRKKVESIFAHIVKQFNQISASYPDRYAKMIDDYEKGTGKKIGIDCESLREFALQGEYDVITTQVF
jgi:hypothetical protein